jgi:SNF2 family DNA or RNA helicase
MNNSLSVMFGYIYLTLYPFQRFIVVCPSSLVMNWAKEFDKFVGKASEPKRIVIRKGGEDGLQKIKSFVPLKPQKAEGACNSYNWL